MHYRDENFSAKWDPRCKGGYDIFSVLSVQNEIEQRNIVWAIIQIRWMMIDYTNIYGVDVL